MNIIHNHHPRDEHYENVATARKVLTMIKNSNACFMRSSYLISSHLSSIQVVWTSYGSGRRLLWQIRVWAPPPPHPVWAWGAAWGTFLRSRLKLRTWRSLQLSLRKRPTNSSSSSQPGISHDRVNYLAIIIWLVWWLDSFFQDYHQMIVGIWHTYVLVGINSAI